MKYSAEVLSDEKLLHLFSIEEDHFNDFKAKDISGKNFTEIIYVFLTIFLYLLKCPQSLIL